MYDPFIIPLNQDGEILEPPMMSEADEILCEDTPIDTADDYYNFYSWE